MRVSKNQFAPAELKFSFKRAINPITITNGNDAYFYFKSIWDKELIAIQEQFYVLYLNHAKEVICWRCLHTGTMQNTPIDKRLLFGFAFGCLASGVIIAHNHTSGFIKPSPKDLKLTQNLTQAANLLDIKLLDHLIIGNNQYYSFLAENSGYRDIIEVGD
jgi:DNA repair protein RadC